MSRAALWGFLILLALGSLPQAQAQNDTVLRRGNYSEPQTLDPHRSEGIGSANILRDLYEGLVSEAADGTLVPGAAESWTISADGCHYRFRLRDDGRWSNGEPVRASDFVYALRRVVDPRTGSKYSQVLSPVVNATAITAGQLAPDSLGVRALDDRTLDIDLVGPTPYFLGLLTHASTYPVYAPSIEANGDRADRPGNLVGNGAYLLSEWVVQSHIRLDRNPLFHAADEVAIDTVYYLPTENVSSELKRYRAGEIDWTYDIPVTQIRWIRENLPDEFRTGPYLGMYYFGFNTTRPPFADQPGLRRALAMVVDREAIVEKLLGTGEPVAYSLVPAGTWNYTPQRFDWADWPMEKRREEARRLYREAGYSDDHPLEIEIRYNTQQDHKRIAIALAWMWQDALGVRAHLVNEEWKVFLQNRRFRAVTQVFRAGWIGDFNDAMTFLEVFQSRHGINDSGYANPAYDALLAQAAREPDTARRRELLQQAEAMALADTPTLPLYGYVSRRMVKPWVVGWAPNIMDHHPTRYMRLLPHE